MTGFDPSNWMAFEDGIRTVCSSVCENDNGGGGIGVANAAPDPKCVDEDWSAVAYSKIATQPDPSSSDCALDEYNQLELDPTGTLITWPGGSEAPTGCNLYDGACDAAFDAIVYPWVSHLYPREDIDIGSRRADFLAVSTTSKITFAGPGGTSVLPLDATVEFSTSSCSAAGCPFYLANVEATQTGDPIEIEVSHEGTTLVKKISDLKVDAVHSAWGILNQGLNKFVMTEGTVALQLEFTLTNTDGNATGDGTFTKVVTNDAEVFGDRTATGVDAIAVQREFIPGVSATIELLDADHVENPPRVSDTLPSSLRCDGTTEVELGAYISAEDPDGDVDVVGWLIDREVLFDTDVGLGNGTYDIAAVAIDTRGAVDVGPTKTLTVAGCP